MRALAWRAAVVVAVAVTALLVATRAWSAPQPVTNGSVLPALPETKITFASGLRLSRAWQTVSPLKPGIMMSSSTTSAGQRAKA